MIIAENIKKSYGKLQVLRGINLNIKKGEIVAIVGASGAGKSTLLHILGTLDKPDSGSLKFADKEVSRFKEKEMARFRNQNIGFIFQFHHLLPEFTAIENTLIPGLIGNQTIDSLKIKALEYFKFLGIEERINHKPAELSGGEQQRVAVARALINNPGVVFADEPSGNLDSKNATELHNLFFELRAKFNQTFVIVTHNNQLAEMADRKITIKDGVIDE